MFLLMFLPPLLLLLLLLCLFSVLVNGALENPGFWDVSQEELDKLVNAAQEHLRPFRDMGSIAELCNTLPGWTAETARKLTNASVVILDEPLLCADFPSTCEMTPADREAWLIDQAAWFSDVHISANLDAIPYDSNTSKAGRRACGGNRALLIPTTGEEKVPLIDVKGIGGLNPRVHSRGSKEVHHSDGKLPLFDALLEYLHEKTIASVIEYHAEQHKGDPSQSFSTVGSYGVISLGFDFPWLGDHDEVHTYPAGAVVRQASRRHPTVYGFMHPPEASMLEQILNTYGLSSDTPGYDDVFTMLPNPQCSRVNMQGTLQPRTVTDFNSFYYDERPWPRPENACLVHWAGTHLLLETPLWKTKGHARSQSFFKTELTEVPSDEKCSAYPARDPCNARMMRMYNVSHAWWHGRVGQDAVQKAVDEGLLFLGDDDDVASKKEAKEEL